MSIWNALSADEIQWLLNKTGPVDELDDSKRDIDYKSI